MTNTLRSAQALTFGPLAPDPVVITEQQYRKLMALSRQGRRAKPRGD
jgi:hypothetical protein